MAEYHGDNRGRVQERVDRDSLPNPITLFEHHLRVLDSSYIAFFQERIRIEETYIASLAQLHQKARNADYQVDQGSEQTTVRQAWREVRDNLDREAESRNAFVSALRADVLTPLTQLRESQDRTRKRIKEDIKDSHNAHVDYMENTLPRLKRAYLKKTQDAEDNKPTDRAGFFPPNPSQAPGQQSGVSSPPMANAVLTSTNASLNSTPNSPPRAPIPSPQPHYPLTNVTSHPSRPSTQPPSTRNRSPSASTSLSDLAHQGKKAFMGFLQDGGARAVATTAIKETFGERQPGALKNVRAKREAEEADKEYRRGIYLLETLRLRRQTILRGGYTSLKDFVWEANKMMKQILGKYVDCQIGTSSTTAQLAVHIQQSLDKINLDKDADSQTHSLARLEATVKRQLPPILYFNYYVGDSKDLIFGTSLVDYATTRGLVPGPGVALGLIGGDRPPDGKERPKLDPIMANSRWEEQVPRIVRLCIHELDVRGIKTEGIHRVSGRLANVQEMRHRIEKDEAGFSFNPQTDDVHCISSLLKFYLRELPEPVFRFPIHERLQYTEEREGQIAYNFPILRNKMRRQPLVHQATLRIVIEHLARVSAHCQDNKMDTKNLSIVFGTQIFGEDEMPKGADVLTIANWKDCVMEDLINYASLLFDEKGINSPPLPQPPANETPDVVDYGSSHTKVFSPVSATAPPLPPRSKDRDFTPAPPPHSDYSIHPGARHAHASSSSLASSDDLQQSVETPPTENISLPQTGNSPSRNTWSESKGTLLSASPNQASLASLSAASTAAPNEDNESNLGLAQALERQGIPLSTIHSGRTPETNDEEFGQLDGSKP